jgi:acid phosphatase type 7
MNEYIYTMIKTLRQQSYFEALFMEYSVNVVFAGHVHAYQRSHPVYNGEVVVEEEGGGPVYIVIGDGGNREGHAKVYEKPDSAWSAYKNDTSFGHGTITIVNDTHMLWEVNAFSHCLCVWI